MTERDFEQRVKSAFRKRGFFCEHLRGPDGFPDLTVISPDYVLTIELKVCNTDDKVSRIFQPTQIPYMIKNSKRLNIFIMAYLNDIKKIWLYYPSEGELYQELATETKIKNLQFPGQSYDNINLILNNLIAGDWL